VIKVFKGLKLESTITLAKFDPHKKLKVAGETVTHVWPSSQVSLVQDALGKGFRVVADAENMLKEADESNNELSRELKCPFKPTIIVTRVDPSLQDLICWYRQHPPNKFKCKVYWFTKFYFYPKIRKIDLICQNGSQDGNNFYPCSTVYPIATDAPNSGEYQFDLPYVNEIGDFVLKIYGYGGAESPPYPVCIW